MLMPGHIIRGIMNSPSTPHFFSSPLPQTGGLYSAGYCFSLPPAPPHLPLHLTLPVSPEKILPLGPVAPHKLQTAYSSFRFSQYHCRRLPLRCRVSCSGQTVWNSSMSLLRAGYCQQLCVCSHGSAQGTPMARALPAVGHAPAWARTYPLLGHSTQLWHLWRQHAGPRSVA